MSSVKSMLTLGLAVATATSSVMPKPKSSGAKTDPASASTLPLPPMPHWKPDHVPQVAAALDYDLIHPRHGKFHAELGDGWGCAVWHDGAAYCWRAPNRRLLPGERVVAEHIPWLDDRKPKVGPDRICIYHVDRFRCWRAPEFMDLPRTYAIPTAFDQYDSFTWYDVTKGPLLDSSGDDASTDNKSSGSTEWFTPEVVHGSWHGCSNGLCWGTRVQSKGVRICQGSRVALPCDVVTPATLRQVEDFPLIIVGDLYACTREDDGLYCAGASRDGFFGSTQQCPPELLKAWPTVTGPVAAPNAKCSRVLTRVGSWRFNGNRHSAGSRGLCIEDWGDPGPSPFGVDHACFGAVAEAPFSRRHLVVVGLGDQPSACGYAEGQFACWGAGYGTDGAARFAETPPVPVEFEFPWFGVTIGQSSSHLFHPSCAVHHRCAKAAFALPHCPSLLSAVTVDQIAARTDRFEGKNITVTGLLNLPRPMRGPFAQLVCGPFVDGTRPSYWRGGGAGDYCCDEFRNPVVLSGITHFLPVDGQLCSGDTSRACCNLPVLGQPIAATGLLTRDPWGNPGSGSNGWVLAQAKLCELSTSPLVTHY